MADGLSAFPQARRFSGGRTILRLVAGAGLIALLVHLHLIDGTALATVLGEPRFFVPALLLVLASIPLEALRWHILLRAQGVRFSFWATVRVVAMGLFFANMLPGAAGGDLVRAIYVYRTAKGRRAPAFLSILMDRVIGFVGFVAMGFAGILLRPGHDVFDVAVMGASGLIVAALGGFLLGPRLGRLFSARIARRSPRIAQIVDATAQALDHYARDRHTLAAALLVSFPIVALAVAPIVLLAAAMPFPGLTSLDYAIAGLYALLANSLPLTPGGLGLGETAFTSACAMLVPQAAPAAYGTIFLAFRCVIALASLPGLAAYLADSQGHNGD